MGRLEETVVRGPKRTNVDADAGLKNGAGSCYLRLHAESE